MTDDEQAERALGRRTALTLLDIFEVVHGGGGDDDPDAVLVEHELERLREITRNDVYRAATGA